MKHNAIYALRVICLLFLLPFMSLKAHTAPQLPEPDLAWKNISVGGKTVTVFCMFRDSRGLMWMGTNCGLDLYDGVATRTVSSTESSGLQIYAIAEHADTLYLGTNHGVVTYCVSNGQLGNPLPSSPKEIRCMLLDGERLWIGSLDGISILHLPSGKIHECSGGLPHRSVYSLLRDSRGVIYAGTYNGLGRYDNTRDSFSRLSPDMNGAAPGRNLFVNCMLESADGNTIYVGTEGALYRYSPVNGTWERDTRFNGNNIKSMARSASDHILVGTDNGMFDLNGESLRHYRHDSRLEETLAGNEIWSLYADSANNLWAGHELGFSLAANSLHIRAVKLATLAGTGEGNEIFAILRDSRGNLWLGGTNGVILLSDDGTPRWFRHSDSPNSLSHNRIRSIDEDSEHNIWLSTDGGINRYNPTTGGFDVFHIMDGNGDHNSNWVYAMEDYGSRMVSGSFLGGIHFVDKSRFGSGGGPVTANFSLNSDTPLSGSSGKALVNDLVNDVETDSQGNIWILLFRDETLSRFDEKHRRIKRFNIHALTGQYPTNMSLDARQRMWCGFYGGAVMIDGDSLHTVRFPLTNSDEAVLAMGKVGDDMWVSTQSNVWRIDGNTLEPEMLALPQKAYRSIYDDTPNRKVYLGTLDEIIEVDQTEIGKSPEPRTVKLIAEQTPEGEVYLSANNVPEDGISLPYGGNVTLLVSSLDYSPDVVQRYAYRLVKNNTDSTDNWIVLPEGANAISLTDLSMGHYKLMVKSLGSSAKAIELPVDVSAPWTLSWWAIILYCLIAAGILWAVVWQTRRRNLLSFREKERKKSLELVEKKLTFLSNISHDLKTPLSMILGPVSLMREKTTDPATRHSLDNVYANAVKLNNMIHRTLELNHLDDSAEDLLILSTFDAVEFCRSVFEAFRENNPKKRFVFHSSTPSLYIEADAVKFESVITNLLSNACKYSDEGATISCGISRREGLAEIVVSDDGIGIPESDQPLVFQRMFRAPSSAKLREGTGLGLYLIKKYLELMQGTINLYSREGQGTSFIVTLPLTENPSSQIDEASAEETSGRPRILIVEDNIQISRFIKQLLEPDYQCQTADNGRAGLALASSFSPHLIIADEMMPIMTGLEMCRRMKQNPRLAHIPTIMLTAKTDNATENESIKLGLEIFMPKPFEPSALKGRIAQLLKSRAEIEEKVRIDSLTDPKPIEAESVTEKQLARIAKIIEENVADPELNVNMLCEKSGIPNKQLYRMIKKYMGVSPLDYIRRVRLQKAAMLLSQHRFSVSEVSYMVGFNTPSYFAKCFQAQYGVKPSHYRSEDEPPAHGLNSPV